MGAEEVIVSLVSEMLVVGHMMRERWCIRWWIRRFEGCQQLCWELEELKCLLEVTGRKRDVD